MHHPAFSGAHFEIHAAQDVRFIDVHVGVAQRHQHAAALGRGRAHARPAPGKHVGLLLQQLACRVPRAARRRA